MKKPRGQQAPNGFTKIKTEDREPSPKNLEPRVEDRLAVSAETRYPEEAIIENIGMLIWSDNSHCR